MVKVLIKFIKDKKSFDVLELKEEILSLNKSQAGELILRKYSSKISSDEFI